VSHRRSSVPAGIRTDLTNYGQALSCRLTERTHPRIQSQAFARKFDQLLEKQGLLKYQQAKDTKKSPHPEE